MISGTISMIFCGHVCAQMPQPMHAVWLTQAMPSCMEIAPCGQALTQSPKPMQPKMQLPLPP